MGNRYGARSIKRVFIPLAMLILGWSGGSIFCCDSEKEKIISSTEWSEFQPRLPSKSAVAKFASIHFGSNTIGDLLECSSGFKYSSQHVLNDDVDSPYHVQTILSQYSQDHFKFGSTDECNVPVSRTRVQKLLHQIYNKDGGTVQCPEVGDIYESIARGAPDGTVFCETGFNVGSSAAIFLHGSFGSRCELHSFDVEFPSGVVDFLNDVYSPRGKPRLHAHKGDIRTTLENFRQDGNLCDVVFLDAKHPDDLTLTSRVARGSATLFLYHWHFRNKESKTYFMSSLYSEKTFLEKACVKTLCDLSHENAEVKIIRESCFGRLQGVDPADPAEPDWWHAILG